MRLITLEQYRRLIYAPGSEPHMATLRRRLTKIPGGTKVGGRCYVDLDIFDRVTGISSSLAAREAELRANPALEGLL